MGFSGKPSKGCTPCREKRTKCDLALPACTQCLRKNRMCFGYRKEEDLMFRNETGLVIRKVKRKRKTPFSEADVASEESVLRALDVNTLIRNPSRRASLLDEAIMHWQANFNETFFSRLTVFDKSFFERGPAVDAGFEYILPVYMGDLEREGPAVEIVRACGLASLGNSKGAPDLLRAARVKQVKVLRQLNEQLKDPELALSDSSVATCLMLSSFENICCDGAETINASETHLEGAATLIKLRGGFQFSSLVGFAMFERLRGTMLAMCLLKGEPLPPDVMELQGPKLDDHTVSYKLMGDVCSLRAEYKRTGSVSPSMAKEAQTILDEFAKWDPELPTWVLPDGGRSSPNSNPNPTKSDNTQVGSSTFSDHFASHDKMTRLIWFATSWLLIQTARILVYELVIVYLRAQQATTIILTPSPSPSSAPGPESKLQDHSQDRLQDSLQDAITAQTTITETLKSGVEYYISTIGTSHAATRGIGAHMLMMPLSGLLGASSTTGETMVWIARMANKVSEVFALKQGKMVSDFLNLSMRAQVAAKDKAWGGDGEGDKRPMMSHATIEDEVTGSGNGSETLLTLRPSPDPI